jgi:polysaccharide biosynthesis/export protein
LRSQLLRGQGARPDILIIRKTQTGRARISADEDTELQPGDVVEISLLFDK